MGDACLDHGDVIRAVADAEHAPSLLAHLPLVPAQQALAAALRLRARPSNTGVRFYTPARTEAHNLQMHDLLCHPQAMPCNSEGD